MKQTIVVIDGEPVVRNVITRILEKAGYLVTSTGDLNSVLDAVKRQPPALVITNVLLPGISGHDAMRLIKAACDDVPVLMVSGLPSEPVIQHWINEDGFDIFPKPFTSSSLVLKVQELIGHE